MTIFTRPQWCIEPLRPHDIAEALVETLVAVNESVDAYAPPGHVCSPDRCWVSSRAGVSGHHRQPLAIARLQRSLRAGKETPGSA